MRTSPTRTPDMNLTELMARQNKPILVCTGIVLLAVAIVLDKVSPPGFEVSVFYLVPVPSLPRFWGGGRSWRFL